MDCVLTGGLFWSQGEFKPRNIVIQGGIITAVTDEHPAPNVPTIDCQGFHIFPGFTDVHVHLREPGFSYKETMATGTRAAARGGYTALCTMPNLNPTPDSIPNLQRQLDIIARDAVVQVIPLGTITRGEQGKELSDMAAMAQHVAGYSDDGRGVQNDDVMLSAMQVARRLNKIIVAHCEDEGLPNGPVNDSDFAREHNLPINAPESEWGQLKRDIELLKQSGAAFHACHLSTKESVALVRQAKKEGLDITCETAPHYLLLNDTQLENHGRYRMNPPIRGEADRLALLAGVLDGTVDMIATDHAPHSAEEKSKGMLNSAFGVVGLETAFPLLYTRLVKPGLLPMQRLITCLHDAPNRRFRIDSAAQVGQPANLSVWDLSREVTIDPAHFQSMGRATPFEGERVFGACLMTVAGGNIAWREGL